MVTTSVELPDRALASLGAGRGGGAAAVAAAVTWHAPTAPTTATTPSADVRLRSANRDPGARRVERAGSLAPAIGLEHATAGAKGRNLGAPAALEHAPGAQRRSLGRRSWTRRCRRDMKRRVSRARIALVLALVLTAGAAHAGSGTLDPKAKAHLNRGLELYAQKDYAAAIAELEATP